MYGHHMRGYVYTPKQQLQLVILASYRKDFQQLKTMKSFAENGDYSRRKLLVKVDIFFIMHLNLRDSVKTGSTARSDRS